MDFTAIINAIFAFIKSILDKEIPGLADMLNSFADFIPKADDAE